MSDILACVCMSPAKSITSNFGSGLFFLSFWATGFRIRPGIIQGAWTQLLNLKGRLKKTTGRFRRHVEERDAGNTCLEANRAGEVGPLKVLGACPPGRADISG